MKKSILLIAIIFSQLSISQTEFSKGYKAGYIQSINYNNAYNLGYVLPPLAPLPRIIESTFQDGYNRGLIEYQLQKRQDAKFIYNYNYPREIDNEYRLLFIRKQIQYNADIKEMANNPEKYFEKRNLGLKTRIYKY